MAAHGAVKLFNRFKVKTTFPDPVLAKDIFKSSSKDTHKVQPLPPST